MRYYSIIIFLLYTLVLQIAIASPHSQLKKNNIEESEPQNLDSIAEPVHLDSMSISDKSSESELNTQSPPPNTATKTKVTNNIESSSRLLNSKSKLQNQFEFFPEFGFYSGPSTNLDTTSSLLLGIQISYNKEENSFWKIGFTSTPIGTYQFFTISKNFELNLKSIRSSYYNVHFKLASNPEDGIATIVNFQNYFFGLSLGGMLTKNWILESSLELLTLKGLGFGVSFLYIL